MQEKYLDLLKEMIRCRGVSSDIVAVNRSADCLKRFLQSENIYCTEELVEGRKVIYAATFPGKFHDLLLNAHIDVVPAAYDFQYDLKIEDNLMYGRGTCDCLGNVIAIVKFLAEAPQGVSVGAIFSSDEEIGGKTVAGMVKLGYGAKKAVLVVDGSGRNSIVYAQKGIISLRITAHGVGGHSSRPWSLDNPIDHLVDGYINLRNNWQNPTAEDTWGNSLAACIISGGEVHNAIPDTASMLLNIRYVSDEDYEPIIARVRELTGLEVEIVETCPPVFSDISAPQLKMLAAVLDEVDPGTPASFRRMMGATDARHLKELGVPIGIIGIDGGGVHGKCEYAELAAVDRMAETFCRYSKCLAEWNEK